MIHVQNSLWGIKSLTCIILISSVLNQVFTFPAVSGHVLMRDGLNGQCSEKVGNAKKLFGALVAALARRMYIT